MLLMLKSRSVSGHVTERRNETQDRHMFRKIAGTKGTLPNKVPACKHRPAPCHSHAHACVRCSASAFFHPNTMLAISSAVLADASVTHCCADVYVAQSSTTVGAAAEARPVKKVAKYALHEPGGHDFTPLVSESYGRLCSSSLAHLNK
jgi:hypothetical protein